MASGARRRLLPSQLHRLLVLVALAPFFTDGVLAVRLISLGRIRAKRGVDASNGILREVLSPLYSRIAAGQVALAGGSNLAPLLATGSSSKAERVSAEGADAAWLRDLATVFSSEAARRLPRLAQDPSVQLEPGTGAHPQHDSGHSTEAGGHGLDTSDLPLQHQQRQQQLSAADPPPPEFNVDEARVAGQLASIAYCSHPDLLAAWNCSRCVDVRGFVSHRVVYDSVWDLAAYAGYYAPWNAVVLSFRGTDSSNWGQWAENMRAWRTDHMYPVPDFPHALIHAGFYTLWTGSTLQATFAEAVSELMTLHPTARMVAIGHSMGGALAQLAALEFKLAYNGTSATVYTFGSPRVGNLAYQQLFNSLVDVSWRFTHNRDIVPSVPLQLMGFQHVAREVWEVDVEDPGGSGGVERKLLLCDATGEDPSCHNSACYLGLCTSIADHLSYLGLHMYQDNDEC